MDLETLPEPIEDDLPLPVYHLLSRFTTSTFSKKSRSFLQIALIPTISLSGRYLFQPVLYWCSRIGDKHTGRRGTHTGGAILKTFGQAARFLL